MNPYQLRSFKMYPFSFHWYVYLITPTYKKYTLVTSRSPPQNKKSTTTSNYELIYMVCRKSISSMKYSPTPHNKFIIINHVESRNKKFTSNLILCLTPPYLLPNTPPTTQPQILATPCFRCRTLTLNVRSYTYCINVRA